MLVNSTTDHYVAEHKSDITQKWLIAGTSDMYEISYIITPSLTNLPVEESKNLINCQEELIHFHNALHKLVITHPLNEYSEIYQTAATLQYSQLPIEKKLALIATTEILQELTHEVYPAQSAHEYASWALQLLVNHLENGATLEERKIKQLCNTLTDLLVHPRSDDESNNPSFLLTSTKSLQNKAIFKIPRDTWEASHQRVIQNFPLYHVHTHALVGYETDAILGFHRTPETVNLIIKNKDQIAILQPLVPDAQCFSDLYEKPNSGTLFKNLDKGDVHVTVLSDIIQGVAAGHLGNYELIPRNGSWHIQKFDLKECLIPFNKIPQEMSVKKPGTKKELSIDVTETIRKTIIMARISILGLPQCNRPFDKAALMTICHPSLSYLMNAHHKNILNKKYLIQKSALQAQYERLIHLQNLAKEELQKNEIKINPRQVFYSLFGGCELYDLASSKGYHPLQIFNNIIGNAYRHEFIDLSRPETMKNCDNTKPSNKSKKSKIIFENIQTLYS